MAICAIRMYCNIRLFRAFWALPFFIFCWFMRRDSWIKWIYFVIVWKSQWEVRGVDGIRMSGIRCCSFRFLIFFFFNFSFHFIYMKITVMKFHPNSIDSFFLRSFAVVTKRLCFFLLARNCCTRHATNRQPEKVKPMNDVLYMRRWLLKNCLVNVETITYFLLWCSRKDTSFCCGTKWKSRHSNFFFFFVSI